MERTSISWTGEHGIRQTLVRVSNFGYLHSSKLHPCRRANHYIRLKVFPEAGRRPLALYPSELFS